jgi:hypothetical protein
MAERIALAVGNLVDASQRGCSGKAAGVVRARVKAIKELQHAHAAINRRSPLITVNGSKRRDS